MTRNTPKTDALEPFAGNGQQALEGWLRSNQTLVADSFELARRSLAFSQARLAQDFDLLRVMAGCRDMAELAACQKRFAERASSEYLDYTRDVASRLGTLLTPPRA